MGRLIKIGPIYRPVYDGYVFSIHGLYISSAFDSQADQITIFPG